MTLIFDALRKSRARAGAVPFPPAVGPSSRPPAGAEALAPMRPAAPSPALEPRIDIVPAVPLPPDVTREMTALRVGLESALEDRTTRVVMFLGSLGGEGTTTVASEFARALAADGRVHPLLLDLNARRPALAARFGLGSVGPRAAAPELGAGRPAFPGGTLSVAGLTSEIHRIGARAPSAVRDFLAAVANQYEWVIVDGPPVLEAPESVDVAPLVDGVVLVVRSGHTKRPVVTRAVDLLRKSGVRLLGSVLNRRRLEIPDFIYRRI